MAKKADLAVDSWGRGDKGPARGNRSEAMLERLVSRRIRGMSVVCLPVEDAPGPDSLRAFIARNAIALLSGFAVAALNPARAAATAGDSLCLWFMYILIWRSVTCGPGMEGLLWSENPRLSTTRRGRRTGRPPGAGQSTTCQPIQSHIRELTSQPFSS